uniref:Integrase catalytic domain-containing protein n=1 Tax=Heterorhabditis bacteriophora TaxID=37862 RepID=A0A1I7W8R0_HETBA
MENYKDSKKYFQEIHMNLRDFLSSDSIVNHSIPDNDRTKPDPYKLLGLNYNIKTDSIEIEVNFPQVTSLTKRKVISLIHSVFDPIGITVPLLVKHKLFLRNLFVNNLKWDDILQPGFISEWNSISMSIDGTVVSIPRHIGPSSLTNESELWVFADASKLVYACCAYISHRELGESSRLVSGKAHSIVYIVSDSKVALSWIISTRSLPIFVRNQNPADVGTRGCSGKDIASSLWLNGPTWCSQTCDRWPLKEVHQIEGSDTCELQDEYPDEQLERNMYVHITNTVETRVVSEFPIKKFSTFIKLIRVVANMLLFVKLCVSKGIKRKVDIKLGIRVDDSANITSELMDRAEIIIIISETLHISIDEVKERFKDRVIIKDKDGLIRYRSRMQNADVTYDFKNPIFIPGISPIVNLILRDNHIKYGHCGKQHLIAIVSQKYWIPGISRLITAILKSCVICKRVNSLSFRYPATGSLPPDRVVKANPFQNSGIDLLGPFDLKENNKAYICLFTCLVTRAVHLECVENLSASAFLKALQRFIARRGVPSIIRSDQGSNFILAEYILSKINDKYHFQNTPVKGFIENEKIKWIFNPPSSPWMGGVWERLVQSVKRAYIKMIGRKKLSFIEMNTIIINIEAILNSRPITHVDPNDISAVPIRPIDFISQRLKFSLPSFISIEEETDPDYVICPI